MKVTRHNNEVVILTNAGEILHIFVPRSEHFSPQDFVRGTILYHDMPVTIIDLGDTNERPSRP